MGAQCGVNKKHATSKIKDKFTEFRQKFFELWKSNPFYKFLQEDIDFIDKKQQELITKGPEFFVLDVFINELPKVDPFNKVIFNHLNKIYFQKLTDVLEGKFPDVGQFFLNVVIFLLSNPNMSTKKKNLAESFINCYLERPKKKKKNKKDKDKDKETQEGNPAEKGERVPTLPDEAPKKKLNLTLIENICRFLINFSRNILIYFILSFIFVLESSRNVEMFNFDGEVKDHEGNPIMMEFESTFLINFKMVNREFNKEHNVNVWRDYLLSPFSKCKL